MGAEGRAPAAEYAAHSFTSSKKLKTATGLSTMRQRSRKDGRFFAGPEA